MKISFTTLAAPDWTIEQFIEAAKASGYDGIDLRGYKREMDLFKLPEFTTDAAATKSRFADAGIVISAFSSNAIMFRVKDDEKASSMEQVKRYAQMCDEFGVEYIRVFDGALEGATPEKAVEQSVETLEKMAEIAAPARIAVETHGYWVDSSRMAKVMLKVRAQNVGVLWDLHHPYRLAGEDPEATYRNIGQYVIYTHIKDSRVNESAKGGFEYCLPGEGDVPNERMINMLKDGGYDGWLTLEWEKYWRPDIADAEIALPAYAKFLRRFM